jgi:hypothetical protein
MEYDQYRPVSPLDMLLVTIHELLDLSFMMYQIKMSQKPVVGIAASAFLRI